MFDKLRKIGLDEIYWLIKLGMPKRKATIYDIRQNPGTFIKEPIFFLSTGRCGTKWFSELLKNDNKNAVFHSPVPSFAAQSKLVYEIITNKDFKLTTKEITLIKEIFFAGREQHLRYTYKTKKRYIETNNYVTFFAPLLIKIFPDAKFVQLVRHPGEFICSGLNRGYYELNNNDDIKRIKPIRENESADWNEFSRYRKIAWLWNETNLFIENFFSTIPRKQYYVFPFDLSNSSEVNKVLKFLSLNIPLKKIEAMLHIKKNQQKILSFPAYKEWTEEQKEEIKTICSLLAKKYGFKL